jgi:hypothetical protein
MGYWKNEQILALETDCDLCIWEESSPLLLLALEELKRYRTAGGDTVSILDYSPNINRYIGKFDGGLTSYWYADGKHDSMDDWSTSTSWDLVSEVEEEEPSASGTYESMDAIVERIRRDPEYKGWRPRK